MKLFSNIYKKVLSWSNHPHCERYLIGLSLTESSFFPIPPDIMLLPMSISNPNRALYYAFITTLASVVGGILGYMIGMFLFSYIGNHIVDFYHAQSKFDQVKVQFSKYGIWVILVAGFTPIPYKLFTITAGVLNMALLPFILASLVGRGARFALVASFGKWFGPKYADKLHGVIDIIGWTTLIIIIIISILYVVFK